MTKLFFLVGDTEKTHILLRITFDIKYFISVPIITIWLEFSVSPDIWGVCPGSDTWCESHTSYFIPFFPRLFVI